MIHHTEDFENCKSFHKLLILIKMLYKIAYKKDQKLNSDPFARILFVFCIVLLGCQSCHGTCHVCL